MWFLQMAWSSTTIFQAPKSTAFHLFHFKALLAHVFHGATWGVHIHHCCHIGTMPSVVLTAFFVQTWRKLKKKKKVSLTTLKPLTVWITKKLWKILKELGLPDHLTCFLRNVYAGQEATRRIRHGTTDWLKIGKGVHQGCMLSPCLSNLYAEYIMWNARMHEAQAGIRIAVRNINNLRYVPDTTLMKESEE